jgi:hypothetical protein
MLARAILKQSYFGPEIIRVNLRGKGIIDCDTKIAMLAAQIKADYWEIQYNLQYDDAATLVVQGSRVRVVENKVKKSVDA